MTARQRTQAASLVLGGLLGAIPTVYAAKKGVRYVMAPTPTMRIVRSSTHHRPAPPLSYLRYNSYSVNEFLQQLNNSSKLRQRYANHFHIAPEQVIPYFRENLVESFVPRTRVYPVWMSTPDGTKFVRYQRFRAGTRVLALRNGQPVLKWACGNPLSNRLPVVKKRVAKLVKKVKPTVQKRTRIVNVETPFETPAPLPALPPAYQAPASQLTRLVSRQVIPAAGRFPVAALLPLAFAGGGGGNTPPPPPPPPPPPSVPEPSSMALGLVGLAGVAIFRRRA